MAKSRHDGGSIPIVAVATSIDTKTLEDSSPNISFRLEAYAPSRSATSRGHSSNARGEQVNGLKSITHAMKYRYP
jgi:hypothetical protein